MIFGQFMSYYKGKDLIKNFLQKLRPENQLQALSCLQRIKHNFYWQMKYLKQTTFIRYVLANLSKFVQISMLNLFSLKIKKDLELVSGSHFSQNFLIKKLFCDISLTGPISLADCLYFPSSSIICVLCFMLFFVFHAFYVFCVSFDDVMIFEYLKC